MTKQIHIRLDDMVYSAAVSFAESSGKTLQDIVNDAVKLLIANRAQAQNRNNKEFTFIDLFAGIGGMRIAFSTGGYRGGRRGLTDPATGRTSQGGRFITRRQQYYNVRKGLGMSGG